VKILSNGEYLEDYFKNNHLKLQLNYPGLTLNHLRRELESYYFKHSKLNSGFLEMPYLKFRSHPLSEFIAKVEKGIPLEYINSSAYFYKSELKVSSSVLIPRSETEILVENACNFLNENFNGKFPRVIDVGVGSGAIILSILSEMRFPIEAYATDVSDEAISLARENFYSLKFNINPKSSLEFIKTDRLNNVQESFDLIVTNPPYIKKQDDIGTVHKQVLEHEPHLALFLDDEIYNEWFVEFLNSIIIKLNPGGMAIIEGHENHLNEIMILVKSKNSQIKEIEILKDYTKRDRFLKIRK
jgi:release factor glutamine methyltransferase